MTLAVLFSIGDGDAMARRGSRATTKLVMITILKNCIVCSFARSYGVDSSASKIMT